MTNKKIIPILMMLLILIILNDITIQTYATEDEEWKFNTNNSAWFTSVSKDGEFILTETSYQIYFHRKNGELLWTRWMNDFGSGLCIAPNGSFIAVPTDRGSVLLLDRNGNKIKETLVDTDCFVFLSFCPEELFFCSCTYYTNPYETSVSLINRDGEIEWEKEFDDDLSIPKLLGIDSILFVFHRNKFIEMFNRAGDSLWSYHFLDKTLTGAISGNGMYVAILTEVGDLYYFNRKGEVLWIASLTPNFWKALTKEISISYNGEFIAVNTLDYLYAYNKSGNLLWVFETGYDKHSYAGQHPSIAMTPDAQYIVYGSQTGYTYFFDYGGNIITRFETGKPYSVSISGKAETIAVTSKNTLYCFDGQRFIEMKAEADSYLAKAVKFLQEKDYENAETYLKNAQEIYYELDDSDNARECYQLLEEAKRQEDYILHKEEIERQEEAAQYFERQKEEEAAQYFSKGNSFLNDNEYIQAIENFRKAKEIYDLLKKSEKSRECMYKILYSQIILFLQSSWNLIIDKKVPISLSIYILNVIYNTREYLKARKRGLQLSPGKKIMLILGSVPVLLDIWAPKKLP